jgi:hypothetical protein
LIGLSIGFLLGSSSLTAVVAQVTPGQLQPQQPAAPAQPEYEEIAPVIAAGSGAFGILLSGRLATDEIAVKGTDIVKLQENLLNLLIAKRLFTTAELQKVIDGAKVARPLRMKQPAPSGRGGAQ